MNVGMCRAIFRLANAEYYDQEMMLAAANTLLGKGADGDGSIAAAMRHSRWHHVEKNAKVGRVHSHGLDASAWFCVDMAVWLA